MEKTTDIRLKKRKNILFILFSIAILLSGCSKFETDNSNAKAIDVVGKTTTINFVGHWLGEGDREHFVRNFAREYEFQHQNIQINLKFPEEIYYDKLDRKSNEKYTAKVIKEGITDWDILRINGEYSEVLALCNDPDWAKKNLVDFSQIEEFRQNTIPELLTEEAKAQWNGIIPGPWVEGQYWALWCNNKVAEKVGIQVKQFGMTVDDFVGYIKAVDQYNKNHPGNYIAPIYESYVWKTAMAIATNMYGSLLNDRDEFLSKKVTEKRMDAWEKTLEVMESISQYKPLKPDWRTTEWSTTTNSLLNEECLFYVNGSWMYNIWMGIDKQKTMNCMPTEFPGFHPLKFYPGAYQVTWGVLKNAPHREEAVKFLLALNKPEYADEWSRTTKCPTGIKGDLSDVAFGADRFENFSAYIQKNYGSKTYRYYESSVWFLDEKNANTLNYFDEVIEGKMTAKEAMRNIRSNIKR
ncbi:MAG TPA: ABC transporter substrate-binding protein [Prolixibacteraceae bacterium]|nr:ABC transporter substrate-binding protein [Prolixibacteraceae bacterium]